MEHQHCALHQIYTPTCAHCYALRNWTIPKPEPNSVRCLAWHSVLGQCIRIAPHPEEPHKFEGESVHDLRTGGHRQGPAEAQRIAESVPGATSESEVMPTDPDKPSGAATLASSRTPLGAGETQWAPICPKCGSVWVDIKFQYFHEAKVLVCRACKEDSPFTWPSSPSVAPGAEELARRIIERVTRDAVSLAITRSGLEWVEDLDQTEEDIIADAIKVTTGDDMGCLPEDEATPENCTHKFVESVLASLSAASSGNTPKEKPE